MEHQRRYKPVHQSGDRYPDGLTSADLRFKAHAGVTDFHDDLYTDRDQLFRVGHGHSHGYGKGDARAED
jgi:hypothetical protein